MSYSHGWKHGFSTKLWITVLDWLNSNETITDALYCVICVCVSETLLLCTYLSYISFMMLPLLWWIKIFINVEWRETGKGHSRRLVLQLTWKLRRQLSSGPWHYHVSTLSRSYRKEVWSTGYRCRPMECTRPEYAGPELQTHLEVV